MPKSHNRRHDGSIHLKRGPYPARNHAYESPKEEVAAAEVAAPPELQYNGQITPEVSSALSDIAGENRKPLIQRIFRPGPRDLHNQGKHHKYMVIPDFGQHIFHVPHKNKGGEMTLLPDVRAIPLFTLAPRGKTYARGKKRGGPGGVAEFEATQDSVEVAHA